MMATRSHRRFVAVGAILVICFFLLPAHFTSLSSFNRSVAPLPYSNDGPSDELPCSALPGANDTLVVMKTGSTELQDKLPIHLRTTLRCYPNHMIFSDVAETFDGNVIFDALEDVDPSIKASHDDFALYRRLQEQSGRTGLQASELSGADSRPGSASGKAENPGWKLDKWKFLPMMRKTLQEHPDKHWYVFVEMDTYVFWATLLAYLGALDREKPYYIGGQIWIGDVEFAHGGTGYAVSRPALEKVVEQYVDHKREWESFTDGHWAGDCVLGKAFKDSGTSLTRAWPIWQGDDVGNMNYGRTDNSHRLWCHPTVSYHHVGPSVIQDLWQFEQKWIANHTSDTSPFLRHKDVFAEYIVPQTAIERVDWDNHAERDQGAVDTTEACHSLCEKDSSCVQWLVDATTEVKRCMTTSRPNLGESSPSKTSGWIRERLLAFYDAEENCKDESWIT